MPKFKLNKLVRDNYLEIFEADNQKAECEILNGIGLKIALAKKATEEMREIDFSKSKHQIASEIIDARQALDDMAIVCGISEEYLRDLQKQKHAKLGGFLKGYYVETLELSEDDKYVQYYRDQSDKFPEVE